MPINRQWRLASRPSGRLLQSNFTWHEEPASGPDAGEVLVQTLLLSVDPTQRIWAERRSYLPSVRVGDVMRAIGLGIVEDSRHPRFRPGDIVQGLLGWQSYALSNGDGLSVVPRMDGIPLEAHLALFGHIGASAYFGLLDVGRPRKGDTLVVSAAAGAVGSLVGQIGRLQGCRVVGLAGSAEKCRWIVEDLGFDAAIDYKREPVPAALARCCTQGIDIYFDNVGGESLDAALALLNLRARVVVCGMISGYNATEPPPGPRYFPNILVQRARVEGFIVIDYADRFPAATAALEQWYRDGKIKYRADVVEGLEHAPAALDRLFNGGNMGKLLVKVG